MIEGFDKEIDAILRKARDGESVFAAENPPFAHLDADELSAFAENALPEKTKIFYTAHLADCNRCRQILSNIILLNSEAETSPAFVADDVKIISANIPWYRRLFAFPGLAYSLGALVLVFGGLLGFIALQSSFQSEISQSSNKPFETKNSSSNTSSNSAPAMNTAPSNTANTAMNSNSVSVYSSNSAAANQTANTAVPNSSVRQESLSKEQKQDSAQTEESVAAVPQASPTVAAETKDAVTTRSIPNPAKNVERDEDVRTDENSVKAKRETPKPVLDGATSGASTGETTKIGGKTFTRRNNVWYDSEYRNQAVTDITRGSDSYKKLDKDLRQTVERLGGTVVIVWKSKAYRIQ